MTITPNDPRLTAFVLGELSAEEAKAIQSELDQRIVLQLEVAAIRETVAKIETAMKEEPLLDGRRQAADGRRQAADGRRQAADGSKVKRWLLPMLVPAAVTALAASLVVALLLPSIQSSKAIKKEPAGFVVSIIPDEHPAPRQDSPQGQRIQEEAIATTDRFHRPLSPEQPNEEPLHSFRDGMSAMSVGMGSASSSMSGSRGGMGGGFMPAQEVPSTVQRSRQLREEVHSFGISENRRFVPISPTIAALPPDDERLYRRVVVADSFNNARNEAYREFIENDFLPVKLGEFSTFSIDVDTAAYTVMRQYVKDRNRRPPVDSVRLEEYVNYFQYNYAQPSGDKPFATHVDVFRCPWQPQHLLARIGIKGKEYSDEQRPALNLVFLIDVSGSMEPANRLPLVKQGLTELVEKLQPKDRVAIVTYANGTNLALPSVSAREKRAIIDTINGLRASGGTYGESGIKLAYETARKYFDKEAQNRVILCTDGDFNIGTTDNKTLEEMIAEEAKSGVFLTILGFGMGNFKDDRLKTLSMRGNGNYGYIDSIEECRRLLVEGLTKTLFTIAKDVKIQVDFNPAHVSGYRLLGYENRKLRDEDFHNDAVDAGDIGAGHTVTALYEIVPVGVRLPQAVDRSRYDTSPVEDETADGRQQAADGGVADELMFVKLRYKEPDGERSALLEYPVKNTVGDASSDSQFASAVALYGMLLRSSRHSGNGTWETVLELAMPNTRGDKYREEFIDLVKKAKELR